MNGTEAANGESRGGRAEDRVILYSAILFFLLTVALIALPLFLTVWEKQLPMSEGWYLLFTILAAWLGFSLIRTLRMGRKEVIPRQDKAILDGALKQAASPIDEYVKLSGLIGVTGFFRKLEFSGMPLATILMTLILCLFSVGAHVLNKYLGDAEIPSEVANGFFELAKLTLGAFIGSFVTKGRGREEEIRATARTEPTPRPEAPGASRAEASVSG